MQGKRKQYGLKPYVSSIIHGAMGDTLQYMATQISVHDCNFNLWDRGQLTVLLSRTKYAKNSMFIGPKNDTLKALTTLLLSKTQWSNYIEDILSLVTINNFMNDDQNLLQMVQSQFCQTMNLNSFPYRIADIILPEVASGYVYMLISIRHPNFVYIGETKCIRTRIQKHNSGTGAVDTLPAYLRPFGLFAFICGFSSTRSDLRFFIENKWKEERDALDAQGTKDPIKWAKCGNDVIDYVSSNRERFGVLPSDLKLVCLFEDTPINVEL